MRVMACGPTMDRRLVLALALAAAVAGLEAKVKVRAQHDETFNFRGVRTWAWHPTGAGDVKMAVTPDDHPDAVRERFEPVIKDAVARGLPARGLTAAAPGQASDLFVNYYLLISTNMSAQTMGQFVPTVPEWGLPPFSGATQSLRVFETGSFVLDVTSASSRALVWRGVAEAEIDRERTPEQREVRLRAAIAEILKKFPKTS